MITPTTKLAIAIDLDQLAALTREYLAQLPPRDRLESQLRFSHFLMFLRKRQERQQLQQRQETTSD